MNETTEKPAEQTAGKPDTWAICELLGHKRLAGRLTEEERFGVKMARLDCPNEDGTFTTVHFGGASVYCITAVTEAVARYAARSAKPAPVSPWDFPKMLPAPEREPCDASGRPYSQGDGPEYDDDHDEPADDPDF